MACSNKKNNYISVFPHSVYEFSFEKPESIELTKRMTDFLDQVAVVMQNHKEYYLIINGHSDNTADAATNLQRAIARATNAAEYLKKKGISADRLRVNNKGTSEPITRQNDEKSQALNRRLELKLTL